MLFKNIIVHQEIKKNLIKTVNENRISHAQLFYGPEGCGSLLLAIAYAQYIHCTNKQSDDSCGECPSCQKYSKLIHPDLHFVFPVNKSSDDKKKKNQDDDDDETISSDKKTKEKNKNEPPVSDDFLTKWREIILQKQYFSENQWYEKIEIGNKQGIINTKESEIIIKKINFKSFESEYKIMIIWLPERMNTQAANKLLKILEEPPEKTLFIMVSENTELLLPTILSRTQITKLTKIDTNDLAQALVKNFSLDPNTALHLAKASDSNYVKAAEMLNQESDEKIYFDTFLKFMRAVYKRNIFEILSLTEEINELGRENIKHFLEKSLSLIRESLILQFNLHQANYINPSEQKDIFNFAKVIKPESFSLLYNEFNLAYNHIEQNGNPKIIFFDLGLKISGIFKR